MKIIITAAVLIFFVAGGASAREQTLYDIGDRTLDLAETFMLCAEHEGTCSEAEVLALKTDAEFYVRELVGVITSGKIHRLQLSAEQVRALNMKAQALQPQFAHAEFYGVICNKSIDVFQQALLCFAEAEMVLLYYFSFPFDHTVIEVIAAIIFSAIKGILGVLLSLIMASACLLWWL